MNPKQSLYLLAIFITAVFLVTGKSAMAEVVYAPVNKSIYYNGVFRTDADHDGVVDFTLNVTSYAGPCNRQLIKAFTGEVKLRSGPDDGVVQSNPGFAAWLTYGTEVGPDSPFAPDLVIVNEFLFCGSGVDHVEGYLGLKVQMNGETHYGWTLVEVYGYLNAKTAYLRVTVKGFAYETVPGVPITTGDIGLGRFSVAPESLLEHLEVFPDLLLAKPADM